MKEDSKIKPPRHIVWSTDEIDLSDPFQRKWYIKQVLTHGRAKDIRSLDLDEVSQILDELDLPKNIHELWKDFLEWHNAHQVLNRICKKDEGKENYDERI